MSEWKKVKLGEIASSIQTGPFGSQLHQSDYSDEGTPVVMPKDIINGHIDEATIARVEKHHVDRLVRHKITEGDIIYARRGDVGKCAYIVDNQNGWLCGTGCLKVTIDRAKAIPKFVFFQLQKRETIGWVEKHAIGATMLNLNTSILSEVPIELPSLLIQNRVVEILSRYDTLIENYQKQIKLLEEAALRLYKEWFVDLRFPGYENVKVVDGLPEGWKKKKLVDLVDVQYGYAFDGMLFNSEGEGMPILRIRNIPDGVTSDFTTEEASANYIVHNGDIVVGMDGIFHINSWSGGDAYLVQRACSFRPKEEGMKGFIFQAIQEPIKFFEKTLVGATVAHLGKKHIDSIELVVPENAKRFEPFQKLYDKRQGLLYQIRLLTEARDRLLPKLMGGEMEVDAPKGQRATNIEQRSGHNEQTTNAPKGQKH